MKDLPTQNTVAKLEIPRFMGRWYVIANIPTLFEKGAYNATETYTWNEKDQRIDVDFHFNKGAFDGPVKSFPQKAFVYNEKTGAEWRVQPFWPLRFAYLVIALAPDYSDCMIGVPNRGHLWIMSREPEMKKARLDELKAQAQSLGYDLADLQMVPQTPAAKKKKAI